MDGLARAFTPSASLTEPLFLSRAASSLRAPTNSVSGSLNKASISSSSLGIDLELVAHSRLQNFHEWKKTKRGPACDSCNWRWLRPIQQYNRARRRQS